MKLSGGEEFPMFYMPQAGDPPNMSEQAFRDRFQQIQKQNFLPTVLGTASAPPLAQQARGGPGELPQISPEELRALFGILFPGVDVVPALYSQTGWDQPQLETHFHHLLRGLHKLDSLDQQLIDPSFLPTYVLILITQLLAASLLYLHFQLQPRLKDGSVLYLIPSHMHCFTCLLVITGVSAQRLQVRHSRAKQYLIVVSRGTTCTFVTGKQSSPLFCSAIETVMIMGSI